MPQPYYVGCYSAPQTIPGSDYVQCSTGGQDEHQAYTLQDIQDEFGTGSNLSQLTPEQAAQLSSQVLLCCAIAYGFSLIGRLMEKR